MRYDWQSELLGLASLSDQAAADAINAMTVPETLIPRWQIKTYLYGQGIYAIIQAALEAAETPPQVVGLLRTAIAYLGDPDFENLDICLDEVQALFSALMAAKLMTTEQRATIEAMASVKQKYPGVVDSGMIAEARKA